MVGGTGLGKTCAALTLLDYVPENRKTGYYTLTEISRIYQPGQIDLSHHRYLMKQWLEMELTVIDEVGVKNPSDFQFELLLTLFDARTGRPTIWISNLEPTELLKVFDDRVVSRLCSGTMLTFSGEDRRVKEGVLHGGRSLFDKSGVKGANKKATH